MSFTKMFKAAKRTKNTELFWSTDYSNFYWGALRKLESAADGRGRSAHLCRDTQRGCKV